MANKILFKLSLKRISVLFWLISFFLFSGHQLLAEGQEGDIEIGVNERLGQTANLDYTFFDENGDSVRIQDLVDRPTIVSFVYYSCPSICSPLLNGLSHAVNKLKKVPGEDYNVITISVNEDELPLLARQKKSRYLQGMDIDVPENAWRWLTGNPENIKGFTNELGFGFKRVGEDFAHPAVVMMLSGEGKITRYVYGVNFNQFDLQLAILEASEGKVGPAIAKVMKFCFSYDPEGRKYVFNFMRIMGSMVLLCAAIFVMFLVITGRKNKKTT